MIAALEQTPGTVSAETVVALQTASQTGTLSEAYKELAADAHESSGSQDSRDRRDFTITYAIGSIIVISLVSLFLCIWIVPVIAKLFQAFSAPLPDLLDALVATVKWFINYWYFPLIGLIAIGAILCSPSMRQWWRRSRIAGVFRATGDRYSPSVLRSLAVTTRSQRPVASALSAMARFHFDARTRQQLLLARNEIEQGENDWTSLARTGLISHKEAMSLESLDDLDVRSWAMKQLAAQREQKRCDRGYWAWEIVHPIVILLTGAIVAWIGYALMSSLQMLIGVG